MGRFKATPEVLISKGNSFCKLAEEFEATVRKTYEIVEQLVESDYKSDDAIAIATKIKEQKGALDKINQLMNEYGNFCISSGNKVLRTQEDIISAA